jgi:hypothetical protein
MSAGRSQPPSAALRIDADQRPSAFRPGTDGTVPSRTFRAPKRVDDVLLGPEHTGDAPVQLVAPRPEPASARAGRSTPAEVAAPQRSSVVEQMVDDEKEARRAADRQLIIDAIASGRAKAAAKKRAAEEAAALAVVDDEDDEEWEEEEEAWEEEEEEEDEEEEAGWEEEGLEATRTPSEGGAG